MFRLHLTLLSVFLLSTFAANAQALMLRAVSVDTIVPQEIKLTWQFNISADSVTIYKCVTNCNDEYYFNRVAKVKMDINNLEWIDDAETPPLPQNYYSIGWSGSGKSDPQNNMVLTAIPDAICNNSVLLSWNSYINMLGGLDYYLILCREKENDDSFFTPIGRIDADVAPTGRIDFEANYLDMDKLFEFVVQAVSRNNPTISAFSNTVDFQTGNVSNYPVPIRISCVDVVDDEHMEIIISTYNFAQPFHKLYLYKDNPSSESALSLKLVDSMNYSSTNSYRFTDKKVDPKSGLYYYMAIADNKCKVNDTSNVLTNMYLQGWREEKYEDGIIFSRRGFYPLETYELYRLVYEREMPVMPVKVSTNYYIDVLEFLTDGIQTEYKVVSRGGCSSNTITVEHEPLVQFPNAFFPKDEKIENRTFYPIIAFPSKTNYLFVIYNRWGQEVYHSKEPPIYGNYENMQGRWDGRFQGKEAPPGIYAYKLTYVYNAGEGQSVHTGSVLLVR